MQSRGRRVAVIGAGISGLTAAYLLQRANDVTVYEARDRLGGDAHTHQIETSDGGRLAIDSGFVTFSHKSYPCLSRLFKELDVEADPVKFSFTISCDGCGLEYAVSPDIRGLVPHIRPTDAARYLSLLAQIPRFNRMGRTLARLRMTEDSPSLEAFLASGQFTKYFIQHYALPLVSALWSCAPESATAYPASYVMCYLENHGLLSLSESNGWHTVRGGSHTYVERLARTLTDVRPATPVTGVRRTVAGVEVSDLTGRVEEYDAVVMAAHADQSLRLLLDATEAERRVLGSFAYSRNSVLLHTDASTLSRRQRARCAWNYRLPDCSPSSGLVQITYNMNKLRGFEASNEYLVTLNSNSPLDQEQVIAEVVYEHPLETESSVAARRQLSTLTTTRTAYAGSYHGWSSHEDGCRSGVEAASSLGAPWLPISV